jgi:thiosulfate dehydrogenase [quinone] large subunit
MTKVYNQKINFVSQMNSNTSFFGKYAFQEYLLGLLRIFYGFEFLWAFLDRFFGLGIATAPENSFLAGAPQTEGYLTFVTNPNSPFAFIFNGPDALLLQFGGLVDLAYMGMLLVGGVTLILGIGVRIGGLSTTIFFFSVWLSAIPPQFNPFIEEHFLQMWILIFFAISSSGYWLGLGERWQNFLESRVGNNIAKILK